jgi:hypothetical protein
MVLHAPYCAGQGNAVFYGASSNSIGVSFIDANLSPSTRALIVADLQVCLQEWGKQTQFRLGANDPAFVAHLDNPKTCPHYPDELNFPNHVINSPNGFALQIPKKLSDAYTNAFTFAAANSNAVTAAHDFVAFVSSSNFFSTVTSNTIHNYILVKEMPRQYYQAEFSGIVEGLFQYLKYYPPSLLGFYCSTNGPGTNNLYLRLPAKTNPGYGYDEWDGFPAIWHDNKWKICLGYEWIP